MRYSELWLTDSIAIWVKILVRIIIFDDDVILLGLPLTWRAPGLLFVLVSPVCLTVFSPAHNSGAPNQTFLFHFMTNYVNGCKQKYISLYTPNWCFFYLTGIISGAWLHMADFWVCASCNASFIIVCLDNFGLQLLSSLSPLFWFYGPHLNCFALVCAVSSAFSFW